MFSSKVENNLFNEDQASFIRSYLNNKLNTLEIVSFSEKDMQAQKGFREDTMVVEEALGRLRYQIPVHELREDILKTLHEVAHKYNPESKLNSATFARYSREYGKPKLPPHMDKHDCNFTMFYQVESNIDWPLFVQQRSEILQDNDAFLLSTNNTIHWRFPRPFTHGEFTDMIFFHFDDGTQSMLTVQDRYDVCEPWKQIYNRLMIETYGYDFN